MNVTNEEGEFRKGQPVSGSTTAKKKKRLHCYTWDTDSGKENKFSGQEASVC